jgi:hypothetical protein
MSQWLTLETMILSGAALIAFGLAILVWAVAAWTRRGFGPSDTVLPVVLGTMFVALGAQNVLGGFLLAVLGGNESRFLEYGIGRAPAPNGVQASTPPRRRAAAL